MQSKKEYLDVVCKEIKFRAARKYLRGELAARSLIVGVFLSVWRRSSFLKDKTVPYMELELNSGI